MDLTNYLKLKVHLYRMFDFSWSARVSQTWLEMQTIDIVVTTCRLPHCAWSTQTEVTANIDTMPSY